MNKFKKILLGALSALTLGLFVAAGTKVNAGTTNTTYTLDAKVGAIADVSQSTAGYFTIAKGTGSANIGGGNCTATFTSIIDGESYTAVKATSNIAGIQGIKMESKTTITFTTTVNSTSTVTVLWGNNSADKTGTTIKFDGTASTSTVDGLEATTTQTWSNVTAGSHTIAAGTNQATIFEIKVVESVTTEDGTYTVTYNKNGHGTNLDPDQGVTALANPLPILSETGYTFGGWYTDSGLETPAVAGATISADTTLYAKWTVNSSEWCTITFDSNGGSAVASTSQIYGSTYTLPNCTKTGYYLTGWSDGSSTYTSTYTVPSSSTQTLTAQWAATIDFDDECYFTKADSDNNAAASNTMFTVSGKVNTNADAAVSYNGTTYSTPLKMESSTTLSFTLDESATIYVAFTSLTGNCYIAGNSYTKAKKIATNGVLVLELDADSYTITKADTNNIGFIGIIYDKLSDNTTASVEAEMSGTTLRFIGKLTGITDLANIDTIELELQVVVDENTTIHNAGNIYLTTCYTSVINTSIDCVAETNTYYVIYRLNGADALAGKTINKKITVTFTDGSSTTCDYSSIEL